MASLFKRKWLRIQDQEETSLTAKKSFTSKWEFMKPCSRENSRSSGRQPSQSLL
jgi:hypothetical protein